MKETMRHQTTAPIDEEFIFDFKHLQQAHYLNITKHICIIGLNKAPAGLKNKNLKKFNLNVKHFTRN